MYGKIALLFLFQYLYLTYQVRNYEFESLPYTSSVLLFESLVPFDPSRLKYLPHGCSSVSYEAAELILKTNVQIIAATI